MTIEQNITKLILQNWTLNDWLRTSLHYKIYIRANYKRTIQSRLNRK